MQSLETDVAADAQAPPEAFISHSSRDKELFVRPLVECLSDHGAQVWYDEYAMQPGDSLSASIDRGLATSRTGVVVISPSFIETALKSGWTHYELRGIIANSVGGPRRRIVPIWLDVTADDVRRWSPSLADLIAIDASAEPVEAVALSILEVIAPQKAGGLRRQRVLASLRGKGRVGTTRPGRLLPSPVRERRVPGHVPLRALLITQALLDSGEPDAGDLAAFLENLARDLHHERELRIWEVIAGCYSVACSTYDLDEQQRHALYRTLLSATFGKSDVETLHVLTAEVAGPVLEHFSTLMNFVRTEALIGGPEIGIIDEPGNGAPDDEDEKGGDH